MPTTPDSDGLNVFLSMLGCPIFGALLVKLVMFLKEKHQFYIYNKSIKR